MKLRQHVGNTWPVAPASQRDEHPGRSLAFRLRTSQTLQEPQVSPAERPHARRLPDRPNWLVHPRHCDIRRRRWQRDKNESQENRGIWPAAPDGTPNSTGLIREEATELTTGSNQRSPMLWDLRI